MSAPQLEWRIDPGAAASPWQSLFPADGEHRRAIERLLHSPATHVLPDETWLHLHAYELLEAMRGAAAAGARHVQLPFWPECMFAAADVVAHGARELVACMPVPGAVTCVLPAPAAVASAAVRELGAARFDAERYCWSLRAAARRHGWTCVEPLPKPRPAPVPLLPESPRGPAHADVRAAAGAILIDRGRLLLERRPDHARVYAGVWDTPGGHVEAGETPAGALARELAEELGIRVTSARLLLVQDDRDATSGAHYRHFVHVVDAWDGTPSPRAGQRLLALPLGDALRLHRLNPLVAAALRQLLDAGELSFS